MGFNEVILADSIYLPPFLRVVLLGLLIWAVLHQILRPVLHSGHIWHPSLADLSLFIISLAASLKILML
ncbi:MULTISPECIES: DUF1656 domain-containing protein [Vibrio]|uniref:DUF1656 domain-containing protein n=1 Tax=Vibrio proteolyticus NBRC 13287 TaxID=1219065 RepID=U3BFE5_VIBPR|nr:MULTISPECIES: DUF1656 domain-containing protein [unclassified Vibrio]GAD65448.1 hypothetical protein VPR01S_01_02210 [Vibrio proteolyticus NBRC 13287]NAW57908.1 DUF1656 domain-containing protein [Vibrio sp. V36_P2S2PM302]NAX22558.1 DUF1656 domain-containing protein [Vibrio sp. V39_P1S14PM300]NAX26865.1 DUF1656 domain-containing protein [Vibrio sp. V38_P2S17PM301]NAX29237.1 DUF1656 domain-containing protein [Vibrio sp. V37_P2S8PM304]